MATDSLPQADWPRLVFAHRPQVDWLQPVLDFQVQAAFPRSKEFPLLAELRRREASLFQELLRSLQEFP